MKKFIMLFSYFFHPIFIPTFGTCYFLWGSDSVISMLDLEQYLLLVQVVIITILVPITFYFLLKSLGKVDSFMTCNVHQRKWPVFMQIILIVSLLKNGISIDKTPELFYYFVAGLLSACLVLMLLFFNVKASLHQIGVVALLIFVGQLSWHFQTNRLLIIALNVLACGFVASSRLIMKAHTPKELLVGLTVGAVPGVLLGYYWV
ncbi:hypothetical protein B0A58_05790 [Flavobacterium branchiophilum NBRC 15030 = ATCC 35035]|nr:hypothetical protein [Flavobacterium branchiophilum]OXA77227.1 hypothetical protein B0A58_05790 [Flavobacterium branchiophilum NBRC 15030 = ATCC 35035]